jgi:hypothetical protein
VKQAASRIAIGATSLLWLIPSLGPIEKYGGHTGLFILPLIGLVAVATLMQLVLQQPHVPNAWLTALCGVMLGLFVLLYSIANSGLLGPGSDRDDALNVALQALLAGHYPYGVTTYLGNPPTPMPGGLILALPFFLLGNSALQNLAWMPIFIWWNVRYLENAALAFLYLLIFILGCLASLGDFVVGGDYVVNAIYVAVAMDMTLCAQDSPKTWCRYAAGIFLSIAISSRPVYAAAVPILAGAIFHSFGIRRLAEFLVVVAIACAILNGPFFLYDPSRFPTAHLLAKLSGIPQFLHAPVVLPGLGAAIASVSFLVKVTRRNIFGFMAAALAPMFYAPFVYEMATQGLDSGSLQFASYSLPVSLFGALWILREFSVIAASPTSAARMSASASV